MRRQMQWSHLISDKWAPRFHSLWSRSSFLLSHFFVKEPCVWSLFSPSNLSWERKNTTTLSRNYLWEKLLTTFFYYKPHLKKKSFRSPCIYWLLYSSILLAIDSTNTESWAWNFFRLLFILACASAEVFLSSSNFVISSESEIKTSLYSTQFKKIPNLNLPLF